MLTKLTPREGGEDLENRTIDNSPEDSGRGGRDPPPREEFRERENGKRPPAKRERKRGEDSKKD